MVMKSFLFRLLGAVAIGLGMIVILILGFDYLKSGRSVHDSAVHAARKENSGFKIADPMKSRSESVKTKPPAMNPSGKAVTMGDIEELRNSNSISDRIKAVLALREMKNEEAVAMLAGFLDDVDDAVVLEAIDALGAIALSGDLGGKVFDLLEKRAMDPYFAFRSQAVVTAAMIGLDERMMPIISAVMEDGSDEALSAATRAMSFIASEACIPHLAAVLAKSDDPAILKSAANTLIKIDTAESLAVVTALLNGSTDAQQELAAWALTRTKNAGSTTLLSEAIASDTLKESAVSVIASSPAGAEVFSDLFENRNLDNERKINLLKFISNYSKYGTSETRNEMAKTVSSLLAGSTDAEITAAAAEAIGNVQASEDQSKVLEESLTSKSFLVQEKALYAYAQYCTPTTYKPLTDLYWDDDEKIRRTAFFLSSAFLNSSDRPVLEKAATHQDEFIAKQSKILLNNIFDQ
jgi:HEAT repeat protein